MSLLEIITEASAKTAELHPESKYPIDFNPDQVLLSFKTDESSNDTSLVNHVEGWRISETDVEIIGLNEKFFKKLKRQLKNPKSFGKDEFVDILNSYLKNIGDKAGIRSLSVVNADTRKLIEKVGFFMGRDVKGLVLEACTVLELWEELEALITNGLVEHSSTSSLVYNLIEKRRSDLLCACVKHLSYLQSADILPILKYFLSPPSGASATMVTVRNGWENQAISAIEKAKDKKLREKKLNLAKEASLLLMVAHDEFSVSELCLHYLLGSSNLDDVIFSSCIRKLNGSEMMRLIKYLGKWLKKYERFPQVGPCPKASSRLRLENCDWVPTLEHVAKCLSLILDEHFSSLVLHTEFHEELRSIGEVVSSLAFESKICGVIGNTIESLRTEVEGR